MMIIGIDPGVTGAVAFLCDHTQIVTVHDIPIMEAAVGKKKRNKINPTALKTLLIAAVTLPATVYLEKTHAMPENGSVAAYSQGHSAGCIEAVCACMGLPLELVIPQRWKKHFGLIRSDKDASRTKAIQLFPEAELHLKKHHNRGEALLIGRYGQWLQSAEGN